MHDDALNEREQAGIVSSSCHLFFHVFSLKKHAMMLARLCIICCFVVYANSINGITANPFQSIGQANEQQQITEQGGSEGRSNVNIYAASLTIIDFPVKSPFSS